MLIAPAPLSVCAVWILGVADHHTATKAPLAQGIEASCSAQMIVGVVTLSFE